METHAAHRKGKAVDSVVSEQLVLFENVKEISHTIVRVSDRPGIGHNVDFSDEIFDADGKVIGTSTGLAVVYGGPDGSMRQQVAATDVLPGGTVLWTGTYPMEPIDTDHSIPAVGTSGVFLGMVGTRKFQYVDRPNDTTTILRSSLYLHRPEQAG
jgi:hypothetical protein